MTNDRLDTASIREARSAIETYYTQTSSDYAEVWSGPDDNALHLGHFDSTVRTHDASLLRTNEYLASLAPIPAGSTVLDAGCGIGGSSIWLARTHHCRMIAINIVYQQLLATNANAARLNVQSCLLPACADFHELALRDDSVDVVWAIESCVHAYSIRLVLSEFCRVLRESGLLLLADFVLADAPPAETSAIHRLETIRRNWVLNSLVTVSALLDRINDAGLNLIGVRDTSKFVAPSVERLGRLARAAALRVTDEPASAAWTTTRIGNIDAAVALDDLFHNKTIRYITLCARKR
jgi:tocopherol O-methyltransferase